MMFAYRVERKKKKIFMQILIFCTDEICYTQVSIKFLLHYPFLENILEGKARNKHRPVKERKSRNTQLTKAYNKKMGPVVQNKQHR